MNKLCGIFNRTGPFIKSNFLQPLEINGRQAAWQISEHEDMVFAASDTTGIFSDNESGFVITGEVTLYNRDELKRKVFCEEENDLKIVLEAYKKWGIESLKEITGDFAFAIYDKKEKIVFCARDPLGQVPFFYFTDSRSFLFSNRVQQLSAFSFASDLDEAWIVSYLQGLNHILDGTAYEHIKRLMPGHYMIVSGKQVEYKRYWQLSESATTDDLHNIEEAVERLKQHLHDAVKQRLGNNNNVGIELSGGIDSISIAALAKKILNKEGRELTAYTNILPSSHKSSYEHFTDEWSHASQAASYLDIRKHFGVTDTVAPTLELLKKSLDILGYPSNVFMMLLQEGLYHTAQSQDVHLLLSGFGGNEMLSQFANPNYLVDLMKKADIRSMADYFRSQGDNSIRAYVRAGYHYANFLLKSDRKVFRDKIDAKWKILLLNETYLDSKEYRHNFYDQSFAPLYQTVKERSIYRLLSGATNERISCSYFIASAYGIKYSYPLLHPPLIEYFHQVPDVWKACHKNGRGLFRLAMKDDVPANLIQQIKPTNTSTVPFFKVEMEQNFDKVKEWCLALPEQHPVFRYIDRRKIAEAEYDTKYLTGVKYRHLQSAATLAMFIDNVQNKNLYDLYKST